MGKEKYIILFGVLLALVVVSFAWSTVLTLLIGRSLNDMQPWAVYTFMASYGFSGRAGTLLLHSFLMAFATSGVFAASFLLFSRPAWYGDARWANVWEISKAKLGAKTGVVVGKHGGKYLINNEPVHTLVTAPTRSGKGVGLVIPNLLSWPGAVLVLDIKKENYGITAGFRRKHQPVYMWAPMDEESHRYNPLDFISSDPSLRVTELQKLATNLIPHSGRGETMWVEEARSLFIGLVLLVLDDKDVPHTIGQVYRTLMSETDLYQVATMALEQDRTVDPLCRRLLANFKNKADKERSGVKSNLTAALSLWANPTIDAATSASDFDLRSFRRKPATVYVGVGQDQLLTLAPLLNLFFQQAVSELSQAVPGKDEPYQVLFLIDEFAMLGAMPTLATGLALLAGYNIRIMLIIQGLGQLEEIYSRTGTESILQNCSLQIFFASNDDSTTNHVSKRLGTKTVKTHSRSSSEGWKTTSSTSHIARPLLSPEEVRRLDSKKALIFKETTRPILADKIRYYADNLFTRRLFTAPVVPPLDIQPAQPDRAGAKVYALIKIMEAAGLKIAVQESAQAKEEQKAPVPGRPAPEQVYEAFGLEMGQERGPV